MQTEFHKLENQIEIKQVAPLYNGVCNLNVIAAAHERHYMSVRLESLSLS